jgi:hypothetical protein
MDIDKIKNLINENKQEITSDITIEKIVSEILESSDIIIPGECFYRIDSYGQRFYFKVDETIRQYPSVTSIIHKQHPISSFLLEWWCKNGFEESKQILRETSIYGTFLHIIFKSILLQEKIYLTDIFLKDLLYFYFSQSKENLKIINNIDLDFWIKHLKQDIIGFIKWIQDYQVKPIAIEIIIASEKGYAGCIDLVAKGTFDNEEKYFICDFKSSRTDQFYDDNIIQLEGYCQAWNETYKMIPIDLIYNYGCWNWQLKPNKEGNWTDKKMYRFKDQTHETIIRRRWNHYLEMFLDDPDNMKIQKIHKIQDIEINSMIDLEKSFELINPLDELKKYLNYELKGVF